MSVIVDEVSAEVVPERTPATPPAPRDSAARKPEMELRRECDLLARVARRAARLRAD